MDYVAPLSMTDRSLKVGCEHVGVGPSFLYSMFKYGVADDLFFVFIQLTTG